jgi:hypothetical protein
MGPDHMHMHMAMCTPNNNRVAYGSEHSDSASMFRVEKLLTTEPPTDDEHIVWVNQQEGAYVDLVVAGSTLGGVYVHVMWGTVPPHLCNPAADIPTCMYRKASNGSPARRIQLKLLPMWTSLYRVTQRRCIC